MPMARIDCPCRIGLLPAALDWELLVCCAWTECLLDRFSLGGVSVTEHCRLNWYAGEVSAAKLATGEKYEVLR